jgi:hypothetical protein
VLGLVLLVPTGLVVRTLTAFTLGYSVTLAAATLGGVRLPDNALALAIAACVLLLAVELTRDDARGTLRRRSPWLAALGFGLLAGFAFARPLVAAGPPANDVPAALLAFNVGLELGVVVVVLVVLAGRRLVPRIPSPAAAGARLGLVYTMGILAAFWCFARGALLLG